MSTSDYAHTTYIRKAEIIQLITHNLSPKNETLASFMQRAIQLRAESRSDGVQDEVLLGACFSLALGETGPFHDWATQHVQKDPPPTVPDLGSNARTASWMTLFQLRNPKRTSPTGARTTRMHLPLIHI